MAGLPLHELSGEEVVGSGQYLAFMPCHNRPIGLMQAQVRPPQPRGLSHRWLLLGRQLRQGRRRLDRGVGSADVMAAGGSWHRIPGAGEQRTYRPGGMSRPRRKEVVAPFRLSKVHWSRPFLSLTTAGAWTFQEVNSCYRLLISYGSS
jgi:hypothetical protein